MGRFPVRGAAMTFSNYEILVADNHPLCREGLSNLLLATLGVGTIHQAPDFAATMTALASHPAIGLVSVDLDLPGMRREAGLHELRVRFPRARIVAVTATADRRSALETLASGVHGCIPKDLPVGEIAEAFRMVVSGQIYVSATVSEVVTAASRVAVKEAAAQGGQLTDRQIEVLGLMAAGRSNKEIARQLCIAEGTVKVHIAAAFRLLKVHNRVSAVAAMRMLAPRQPEVAHLPGLFDDRGEPLYRRRRGDSIQQLLPVA